MTTLLEPAAGAVTSGAVGSRQLVLVQTIDIARLTTHPVPIIPGTFVAIGGRGPKSDSNESGKTSFLAAVALLLGDSEWRTRGQGGAGAAAMLFEPETAGVSAQSYIPARHGYVIGVFAEPGEVRDTAMTVWLRISASSPHLLLRWHDGVMLPEQPRQRTAVDMLWASLGGACEAGASTYVEKLYGDVPRCLAYVSRRGRVKSQPSLLQMNAGAFTPQQIAEDLIALTGRSSIYLGETDARQKLYEQQRVLADRRQQHEAAVREEDEQLSRVHARKRARAFVEKGKELWRLHFAAGLLEANADRQALEQQQSAERETVKQQDEAIEEARAELAKLADDDQLKAAEMAAQQRYSDLENQIRDWNNSEAGARARADLHSQLLVDVLPKAEGWAAQAVEAAVAEHDRLSAEVAVLDRDRVSIELQRQAAEARLRDASLAGTEVATQVVKRLRAAGIDGAGLLNAIELEADARMDWEPRLVLFADAVAVAERDLGPALAALKELPGAVLVGKELEGPLPGGIRSAPHGAGALLNELARGTVVEREGVMHAAHGPSGITVVGGFPSPVVGFEARVAAARAGLGALTGAEAGAVERFRLARLRLGQAEDALQGAKAAEQVDELKRKIAREEEAVSKASTEASRLVEPKNTAWPALLDASARVRNRATEVERWERTSADATNTRQKAADQIVELDRRLADNRTRFEWWAKNWGSDVAAAAAQLPAPRKDSRTYGNEASEQLNYGLREVGIRPDSDESPDDPKLAEAVRNRRAVTGGDDRERAQFPAVLVPFEEWLDEHSERDEMLEERVLNGRAERDAQIQLVQETCDGLSEELTGLQDAIEERIRQALDEVSGEYDRLDRAAGGFGAKIEVTCVKPTLPTDTWRWEAIPRWRRSAHGSLLPYDHQTNTAQEKQQTVQLVLAALLASPNAEGRALLLDELGDSLGVQHRREILEAIAACAMARRFTVLATCQDAVLPDALKFCGEALYFEYIRKGDALNRPTRAFGFDANRERVELTAADILRDRPPA